MEKRISFLRMLHKHFVELVERIIRSLSIGKLTHGIIGNSRVWMNDRERDFVSGITG